MNFTENVTKNFTENSNLVEMMIRSLLANVVQADFRQMQLEIVQTEYAKMQQILKEAKKDGLKKKYLKKITQAIQMLSQNVTPYTETRAACAPELLVVIIEALMQTILGYGKKKKNKVAQYMQMVVALRKQRDDMLNAVVQHRVPPEHFLLLTYPFVSCFLGCNAYNESLANFVSSSFSASDYKTLLVSTTAFLILLDFAKTSADFQEDGLPLFQFKQPLEVLKNANGLPSVVYIALQRQGVFHKEISEANKRSLERQYKRYSWVVHLHEDLTQRYIAETVVANKPAIEAMYAKYPEMASKVLVTKVAMQVREIFEKNIFGLVQKKFNTIALANRKCSDARKNDSPLNALMEKIAYNPVTSTTRALTMHAAFLQNLKFVLMQKPELLQIVQTPEMKQRQALKQQALKQEALKQQALKQRAAAQQAVPDPFVSDAFIYSMTMEFDDLVRHEVEKKDACEQQMLVEVLGDTKMNILDSIFNEIN